MKLCSEYWHGESRQMSVGHCSWPGRQERKIMLRSFQPLHNAIVSITERNFRSKMANANHIDGMDSVSKWRKRQPLCSYDTSCFPGCLFPHITICSCTMKVYGFSVEYIGQSVVRFFSSLSSIHCYCLFAYSNWMGKVLWMALAFLYHFVTLADDIRRGLDYFYIS